jgi:hypothetical protein
MVERQEYSQNELFTQELSSGKYQPRIPNNPFFTRMRAYEKVLLSIMGLVLLSIISFSLGVEKGKRVALLSSKDAVKTSYTIQVAAFKNRDLALRQAQLLSKRGLTPLVFAKGNYIILCVGKFSNQESAQPLLNQLQKAYAGCRIRRL